LRDTRKFFYGGYLFTYFIFMVVDRKSIEQNIIALLGIEALPIDQKIALINKMVDLIEQRVIVRILQNLPKEVGDQFAEAVEKEHMDIVARIMKEHVSHLAVLLDEEIERLKHEMVGVVETLGT